MKKRLLAFLLALCLLAALCPAVFADDATNKDTLSFFLTQYEMKENDTMSAVCTARGVVFENYQSLIQRVNNISNFNSLLVGSKYWLPTTSATGADAYYAVYSHKLVSGDTVYGLCYTYGISLNKYSDIIMKINNVTSLTNFLVGKTILIPVFYTKSETGAMTVSNPPDGSTVTTAAAATTTTATASTATATTGSQNSDYVAFYLTKYTLQSGDTMAGVCATRGISFTTYQTIIQNVNNISSFNYLIAGRSYWVPATTTGAATAYYTVYRHTLVSGDTVYNLCNAYGISMNKYSDMIMKLNNVKSLTGFQAGRTILIPVYTEGATVSATAAAASATPTDLDAAGVAAGTSTSSSVTNADGTITTTTTTTSTTTQEIANLFDPTTASQYYLVLYTVKAGDSLISICNGLGTSFSKSATLISTVNNLTSYGGLTVGSQLWLPARTLSGYSAPYYTVVNHTIVNGDTAYGLYKSANDFNAAYKMLLILNPKVNFNWLVAGEILVVPYYTGA